MLSSLAEAYLRREVELILIAVQIAVYPRAIVRVPAEDAVLDATPIPLVEGVPVVVLGPLPVSLKQPPQSGELQGGVHSFPTYSRRHFSRLRRAVRAPLVHNRKRARRTDGRTFPPSILSRDRRKTRSVAVPINSPVRPVAMMESLDKSYTYCVALQPGKRVQSSKNVSHARFQPWVPPKERANVALLRQADVT